MTRWFGRLARSRRRISRVWRARAGGQVGWRRDLELQKPPLGGAKGHPKGRITLPVEFAVGVAVAIRFPTNQRKGPITRAVLFDVSDCVCDWLVPYHIAFSFVVGDSCERPLVRQFGRSEVCDKAHCLFMFVCHKIAKWIGFDKYNCKDLKTKGAKRKLPLRLWWYWSPMTTILELLTGMSG